MCSVTTVYKKLPFASNTREFKESFCLFIFAKAISKLTVEQKLKFLSKFQKLSFVLQTTRNLVISRGCLAEDGKEMCQEL